MSQTAIKVENLSKIYRLGEIGTGSIGQDVDRWFKTKILGKEDPFLKIGESNDRSTKGMSDFIYSLQDINFEINQGDAVGIIGRNGAGKSTLLKILSRVTTPTTGKINIKGRVASLLEVGTGFHPELTGRENIYLNGAILGMRKREIDRKLDEIIDFSGVERYIDTPVKRYSSGMYVRLAFAVAAHLESEILIVDEVLAVGDAEFQKKCLGKMGEVSKGEGRTVLFVSHNLIAVESLCNQSILLDKGGIEFHGITGTVVNKYLKNHFQYKNKIFWTENEYPSGGPFILKSVNIFQENNKDSIFYLEKKVVIEVYYELVQNHDCVGISFSLKTRDTIVFCSGLDSVVNLIKGDYCARFEIPENTLNDIDYELSLSLNTNFNNWDIEMFDILKFKMEDRQKRSGFQGEIQGFIRPKLKALNFKIN
jgi:lipopolysaccharide transport system ATP-binding protein